MGIINEEVTLKWNPSIIKYYTQKGYLYTKVGESFIVSLEDLNPNSNVNIDVRCDYCEKLLSRKYKNICDSLNSSLIKKYACHKCQSKKIYEENEIKQKMGTLSKEDKGYWMFKENRIKELQEYLSSNENSIDNLPDKNHTLYWAINNYDESLNKLLNEIGIQWSEVSSITQWNLYEDFDVFKEKIQGFINVYDKFPTKEEIIHNLKISQRFIDMHGGMYEIKRKMNYNDENDLVDDNGFINKSSYEYIVAQFLIHNGVKYKREQYPFLKNEGYYRSDFMFESLDNKIFHVEVWGFDENHIGEINKRYTNTKREKIGLYNKYDLNLIQIEYKIMAKSSLNKIQEYLKEQFSVIDGLSLKEVANEVLLSPSSLSDDEILETIMKYSDNQEYLPTQVILLQNGLWSYCNEIRKRYGDYFKFAEKVNKKRQDKTFYWNEETIYKALLNIVKHNKPIKKSTLKEFGYMGMTNKKDKNGTHSLIPVRLDFYQQYLLNRNSYIHPEDIKFLENVVDNVGANVKNKVTIEQQKQASEILKMYQLYKQQPLNNAI
jgi:hypothetical protein